MKEAYPHEKRVQTFAYAALGGAAGLASVLGQQGRGPLLGVAVPALASFGLLLAGTLVGGAGAFRRDARIALAGCALLVLAVLPADLDAPGMVGYATGYLFGAALLLYGELVHMTARYEKAHKAVEEENVPEEHINHVTDEALRTLFARGALATLAAAGAVAFAYLLAALGPRAWREAVETTAPLGVAVAALALAAGAATFILFRGSRLRLRRQTPQETAPDVAE